MTIQRRQFLKVLGAGMAGAALVELGARTGVQPFKAFSVKKPDPDLNDYLGYLPENGRDRAILRMSELDRLPWFDRDEAGQIRLAPGAEVPPILDCHTHVGWSLGIGADIDMNARKPVAYYFDHEIPQNLLNVQMHPTASEAKSISSDATRGLLRTPDRNKTHTAANLIDEMNRFGHTHSILLPLEFPVKSKHLDQTQRAAQIDPRLVPFTAIHPKRWSAEKEAQLGERVTGKVRGLKYHPVVQMMPPDAPDAMRLFAWCAENDVVVLSHTGFTGREPAFMRAFSEPERFSAPLKAFPKLKMIFAHTGSRARFPETLAVAQQHREQVWLEFSGQPVPNIKTLLEQYPHEKLIYGTDWPFYPLVVSLARFMVATAGREEIRPAILRDNFTQLLNMNTA
jgi:predicted TIM-barrel fold metal-dependent hydrolase